MTRLHEKVKRLGDQLGDPPEEPKGIIGAAWMKAPLRSPYRSRSAVKANTADGYGGRIRKVPHSLTFLLYHSLQSSTQAPPHHYKNKSSASLRPSDDHRSSSGYDTFRGQTL